MSAETSLLPEHGAADSDHGVILRSLRRLGLLGADERPRITAMVGGVSSDIRLVEASRGRFCVKRALPRLKVAALWEAPVSRNAAEVAWMRCVGEWLPGTAPPILGEDREAGLFAMVYLPPDEHPVWKDRLLAGEVDTGFATLVGRTLAAIHARSARDPLTRDAFANEATFEDIRLNPYLRATGRAHPALADRLEALADRTGRVGLALMHGDVSPKNILVGSAGPVFLDAECACFGDPAFDLAFCLNHLLLKGARAGADRARFIAGFEALASAYLATEPTWEDRATFEARAASLLPALFLARIDGKSPVDYLDERERETVRRCAIPLVADPPARLAAVAAAWMEAA